MVTIMDMTNGERLSDAEIYGEEVLNAGWLPQAMLTLGLQLIGSAPSAASGASSSIGDPDGFLQRLYLAQE